MNEIGLRYTSPDGVRGHLYFYIMGKKPARNGGTAFTIQVQECLLGSDSHIPIYIFLGFYNPHKGVYTLYPKKHLNRSALDYPFQKMTITAQLVYDVSTIATYLPPELRLHSMCDVSCDEDLDDILG